MPSQLEQAAIDSTSIIPTLDYAEVPDLAKAAQNQGVWPRFHYKPVLNKAKSDEAGRPIHDQIEWVTVIIAGDRNSQPSHKVSEIDTRKWPTEYNAFKNGEKMPLQGTPLDEWNQLSVNQRADLKSLGILTVEMLAGLSDEQVQNYGLGGMKLREMADTFISASADQAIPQSLAAENARLKDNQDFLTKQIDNLKADMHRMSDNPESTERNEQLEAMNKALKTMVATLEDNNALLKDKVKMMESAPSVDIEAYQKSIDAVSNELAKTKKELSSARGEITKLKKAASKEA